MHYTGRHSTALGKLLTEGMEEVKGPLTPAWIQAHPTLSGLGPPRVRVPPLARGDVVYEVPQRQDSPDIARGVPLDSIMRQCDIAPRQKNLPWNSSIIPRWRPERRPGIGQTGRSFAVMARGTSLRRGRAVAHRAEFENHRPSPYRDENSNLSMWGGP
jgi:hypothetical protein